MASKIDVSALTLNPQEAQDLSQVVFEEEFVNGTLSKIHDVNTGVNFDQRIVFADNAGVEGQPYSGCTPVEGGSVVFTEKTWTPKLVGVRYTHCSADVNALFKIFAKEKRVNPDLFDKVSADEMGLLGSRAIASLRESVPAKIWFSDTAAAIQPGGYDAQVLAAGKSNTIFRNLYEGADTRLLGHPDVQILVTRTIWDNYLSYLEDTQANGGIVEKLEGGTLAMRYRGIPVILMDTWDRQINTYQDDLTVHVLPNRALMTVPGNIQVATTSTSDLEGFESIYDPVGRQNILDISYRLDAKHLQSFMSSVAY